VARSLSAVWSFWSNWICSLAATIEALEQSCGRGEQKYMDEIEDIQKIMFNLQDKN